MKDIINFYITSINNLFLAWEKAKKGKTKRRYVKRFKQNLNENIDVKNYRKTKDFDKDKDKHLADGNWGSFGFILDKINRINGEQCRGALGFWEFHHNNL